MSEWTWTLKRSECPPHLLNMLRRIAFRFCVVYFGLYCLVSQIINSVLVIPKDRAQDVRRIVEAAKQSGRDDLL